MGWKVRYPAVIFLLWATRTLREAVSPENFGSFKLTGAGTVEAFQGGFVPAKFKRQQQINRGPPNSDVSLRDPKPQKPPPTVRWSDGPTATEQVQSLIHEASPSKVVEPKRTVTSQCQTEKSLEFVSACQVPEAPFGRTAEASVGGGGTSVKALVDTGATINLIRSVTYDGLRERPSLKPYYGSLQTADGRHVAVDGCTTMKLKFGSIDDDIEALVVPELKAEMIIGLRSLKQFQCSLDFHCDNLWTGPQEGSIVPLHYEQLTFSSSQPEATQCVDDPQGLLSSPEPPDTNSAATGDAWQPNQSPTDTEESGHEYDDDHDVWVDRSTSGSEASLGRRHREDFGVRHRD